jgi:hypothetical protein
MEWEVSATLLERSIGFKGEKLGIRKKRNS